MKSCQICERMIKATTGVIAHHGYQRPYQQGWQTSSCFGARHLPYEVSCDAIQPCIDHIKQYVEAMQRNLTEWLAFPPEKFTPMPHYIGHKPTESTRPEGFDAKANMERGSWSGGYEYEHAARAKFYTREIEGSKKDIARLTKRLNSWKPQTV